MTNTTCTLAPATRSASTALRFTLTAKVGDSAISEFWGIFDDLRTEGYVTVRSATIEKARFGKKATTWGIIYGADEMDVRATAHAAGLL